MDWVCGGGNPYTSCIQMLFCRNSREAVVEYLVGIPNVKLTYDGKSDGSSILHLAYRYGLMLPQ